MSNKNLIRSQSGELSPKTSTTNASQFLVQDSEKSFPQAKTLTF